MSLGQELRERLKDQPRWPPDQNRQPAILKKYRAETTGGTGGVSYGIFTQRKALDSRGGGGTRKEKGIGSML